MPSQHREEVGRVPSYPDHGGLSSGEGATARKRRLRPHLRSIDRAEMMASRSGRRAASSGGHRQRRQASHSAWPARSGDRRRTSPTRRAFFESVNTVARHSVLHSPTDSIN